MISCSVYICQFCHYSNNTFLLPIRVTTVVKSGGPSLLGQNWLQHLRLDWKTIGSVTRGESLASLLDHYSSVFSEELGTIRPFTAHLSVSPDARPKFCKARSVSYAMRSAVEEELDRLETQGVLEKVSHSDWATPVVPVPKKDGKTRLCGDYKVLVLTPSGLRWK